MSQDSKRPQITCPSCGDSFSAANAESARQRRAPLATMVRWGVWLAMTAAAAVVLAYGLHTDDFEPPVAKPEKSIERKPAAPSPAPADPLSDVLQFSIVRIEGGGVGRRKTLGTGFVVHSRGLVATNLHVLADAENAQARFKSGAVYPIEGYAAVDREADLAIVQLQGAPARITALPLSYDPPKREQPVAAVGHPAGVSFSLVEGKVSRVLVTADLPKGSQSFLSDAFDAQADSIWIEHSARLAPGNSGGPLLNQQGNVVGVNTWTHAASGMGYALDVRRLAALLPDASTRASASLTPLDAYARPSDSAARTARDLSPETLRQLHHAAAGFRWTPKSRDEYETLSRLARMVTLALSPGHAQGLAALDVEHREELARAADAALAEIRQQPWDAPGQMTLMNDLAASQLRSYGAGLIFFAKVKRVVEGSDGQKAAVLSLFAVDEEVFVPLDGLFVTAKAEDTCLIVGLNYAGKTVRYGPNPLRLIEAPVVVVASGGFVAAPFKNQ